MRKAYTDKNLVSQYDCRHFGGSGGRHVLTRDSRILEHLVGTARGLILDVPCGTGIYSEVLTSNGNRIVSADGAMTMLEETAERQVLTVRVLCDANHLPFKEGVFDGVVTIRLFQHLPKSEVGHILGGLERVIKPGGRVVFDTFRWSPKQLGFVSRLLHGEFHVLSYREVNGLIEKAGLKKAEAVSAYLFSPIMYRRLPATLLRGLEIVENHLPQRWLLRTFWACTKSECE